MKHITPLLLAAFLFAVYGCGSAESVKAYTYNTTKDNLKKAVLRAIKSNPNIVLDTSEGKVIVLRYPDKVGDTTTDTIKASQYHGKDSASNASYFKDLVKFKLKVGEIENEYVLRYMGDEQYWASSKNSTLFIVEAKNKYGHTVSQGHNEHGQFSSKLAKELTSILESELISRVDKQLGMEHS